MQLTNGMPLEQVLGFKALAYDEKRGVFHSPQQKAFIWNSVLMTAECTFGEYRSGKAIHPEDNHVAGGAGCWCGVHITYDTLVALDYAKDARVSPMFLMEAGGTWTPHKNGFRAQQALLRYAVLPDWSSINLGANERATYIASERFGIPVISAEEARLTMDIWNIQLLKVYKPRTPALQDLTRESLLEVANQLYNL